MLTLHKPLAFFDIETTGVNLATDRIVEISILKLMPNGDKKIKTLRLNPTIPIPIQASQIHGIYDADVKDAPTFEQVASELYEFLKDSDIAGYNSNQFDVPILTEEFLRVNIDFRNEKRKFIDVFRIFQKMERRDLAAAYKFYCNKDLQNAHSAEADVLATYEVLLGQLNLYQDTLAPNVDYLHEFSSDQTFVDSGRRLIREDGIVKFNFGKHKGRPVEDVFKDEPQYYDWIMKSDFMLDTKQKITEIKLSMKFKISR
ncbi:3'-5' exonuclease [Sphingobacteriales bacterium UPWRP_1]|nr:DNA polymerase III subunit epsilon [Sphingobacteriales bacterium TSM_CSS]PSJ79039.1 3'-5' exonuclease [Sphingobacteriales bacterium UPWRP_1]